MTHPQQHVGTTAATGTAARPRCQCDQQLGDSWPILVVAVVVLVIVELVRSWVRRRRAARGKITE